MPFSRTYLPFSQVCVRRLEHSAIDSIRRTIGVAVPSICARRMRRVWHAGRSVIRRHRIVRTPIDCKRRAYICRMQ